MNTGNALKNQLRSVFNRLAQLVEKRFAGGAQAFFQLFGAIAIAARPWFGAAEIATIFS